MQQGQETEWQLHGCAVPVPLLLRSLGPLLIPAVAGNWWGPGSAHRARVALGSLALSVALMEAISMSFAVPYEMASKIAVPSVRHQGL